MIPYCIYRMDGLLHFPLPGRLERLRYLLMNLRHHLQAYVPEQDQAEVAELCAEVVDSQSGWLLERVARISGLTEVRTD